MKRAGKPRILITSIFYAPEEIGVSKYTAEMAEWLVSNGFAVRVVTAFPFYPQWRPFPGYPRWRFQKELIRGVEVIRCPLWIPRKVTAKTRLLHLFTYGVTSSLALLAQVGWRPDHVISIMPTVANWPAVVALAKLTRAHATMHVQDFEFDLAYDIVATNTGGRALIQRIERLFYKPFDLVSSISESMVERLSTEKGVPPMRTVLFPNWVVADDVYPLTGPNGYRAQLGLSDEQVLVLYAGNMGYKYDLPLMGQAAAHLRDCANVHFLFCGDGAARAELEAATQGLPNVTFLPLQPTERLNELLNAADIHILPQKPDASSSVMPSKMLNIMASGKPVVATVLADTELGRIVNQSGQAAIPGSVTALADAIVQLAGDPARRAQLGQNGRAFVIQHFGRETLLGSFVSRLDALT